jgi:uncharacterized membrane protein
MSDLTPSSPPLPADPAALAKLIYILYLAGIVVGVTPLIGVVMAYINRGDAEPWVESHYHFQIRTFWMGVLYGAIAGVLCLVLIGFALLFVVSLWFIIRSAIGLKYAAKGLAHPDPATWGFG